MSMDEQRRFFWTKNGIENNSQDIGPAEYTNPTILAMTKLMLN
jgi:hypothetical protein